MRLPVHAAAFNSRCEMCDEPIYEGDAITALPDGEGWVHATCAEHDGYDVGGD